MYGGHLRKATNKIEKNRREKRKGKLPTRLADFVVDIKQREERKGGEVYTNCCT